MKYYNLHTHIPSAEAEVIEVLNVGIHDALLTDAYYSAGLHPWHIEEAPTDWLTQLEGRLALQQVIAIGECGLDKMIQTGISKQEEIFVAQAELAEKHNRPLIIHCVKAWQELIAIKKQLQPTTPWIIHGFRGKQTLAKQLLEQKFFLSFGFYANTESVRAALPDRLFIETDDRAISIKDIYRQLAGELGITESQLKEYIKHNFDAVFRYQ